MITGGSATAAAVVVGDADTASARLDAEFQSRFKLMDMDSDISGGFLPA